MAKRRTMGARLSKRDRERDQRRCTIKVECAEHGNAAEIDHYADDGDDVHGVRTGLAMRKLEHLAHLALFEDVFLVLLDYDSLVAVCEVLGSTVHARACMLDSKKWDRWLCNSYGVDAAQVKALGVPIPPVPHACNELAVSISAHRQWQQFHSNVYILKGDLGTIMHVKGHPVDCLAFPTSAGLTNPGVGVAAVVHDRAGPVLSNFALDYVQSKSQRGWSYHGVEEVFVSPGFKTGMKCLVHCIGPSYHVHGSARLLYNSYAKALLAIRKRNDVTCVAFASISTGILRYPYEPAAMCAMQALRDVIRLHPWPIKVAIVCFEPDALTAFETAKETVEATFFTAPVAYPEVFQ